MLKFSGETYLSKKEKTIPVINFISVDSGIHFSKIKLQCSLLPFSILGSAVFVFSIQNTYKQASVYFGSPALEHPRKRAYRLDRPLQQSLELLGQSPFRLNWDQCLRNPF